MRPVSMSIFQDEFLAVIIASGDNGCELGSLVALAIVRTGCPVVLAGAGMGEGCSCGM